MKRAPFISYLRLYISSQVNEACPALMMKPALRRCAAYFLHLTG